MDDAPILRGVDDGFGGVREPAEIAGAVQLPQRRVLLEQQLQRHRVGQLAPCYLLYAAIVDPGVDGLEEVLRLKELADAVVGVVVDQDRAEQRLLGLDVVRLDAEGSGIVGCHGWPFLEASRWRGLYHGGGACGASARSRLWTSRGMEGGNPVRRRPPKARMAGQPQIGKHFRGQGRPRPSLGDGR